jgi:hypothetical protein
MISMDKKYTSNGKLMRILCNDAPGDYPVVALYPDGSVLNFTAEGEMYAKSPSGQENRLIEFVEPVSIFMNVYPQAASDCPKAIGQVTHCLADAKRLAVRGVLGQIELTIAYDSRGDFTPSVSKVG